MMASMLSDLASSTKAHVLMTMASASSCSWVTWKPDLLRSPRMTSPACQRHQRLQDETLEDSHGKPALRCVASSCVAKADT